MRVQRHRWDQFQLLSESHPAPPNFSLPENPAPTQAPNTPARYSGSTAARSWHLRQHRHTDQQIPAPGRWRYKAAGPEGTH